MKIDVDFHRGRDCLSQVKTWFASEIFFHKPAGFFVKSIANFAGNVHNRHTAIAIYNGVQSDRSLYPRLPGVIGVIGFDPGLRTGRRRRTAGASDPIDIAAARSSTLSGAGTRTNSSARAMTAACSDTAAGTCDIHGRTE